MIYFYSIVLTISLVRLTYQKCNLPEKCRLENIYQNFKEEYNERSFTKRIGIFCDINESFEFKFNGPIIEDEECEYYKNKGSLNNLIILRWKSNELALLDKRFNFSNMISYFYQYTVVSTNLKIWNIKGFDVDIFHDESQQFRMWPIDTISLINCRLDFYHNKKRINSCQDIIDLNITRIETIFQVNIPFYLILRNMEKNENICPLVFMNSDLYSIEIKGMVDTFYKRNVLTFSNGSYGNLKTSIIKIILCEVININLDLNFLHPSIFKDTRMIMIESGSLNSINGEIFKYLSKLSLIWFKPLVFRKINNKQGIEWIKQLNYELNLNLSDIPPISSISHKEIFLDQPTHLKKIPIFRIFPIEDFCIYVDFPFNQLVILTVPNEELNKSSAMNLEIFCTYLWLIQYYKEYYNFLFLKKDYNYNFYLNEFNKTAFVSKSICNFEERIKLCNRSKFQVKDIWDQNDFFILNKKIQIAFKISIYPISFLGLITNFIVVLVILKKENSDLFNEFKQYNYLYLNSLFCILILLIEILSWMTECFYPFEVFCPEIRKLVAIQFFKIIFQECFVTISRFMCNFTYIAFALNRISLIGREHGKIVTFMSELGVKKYIGITLLISASFSWIKGFKYEVNYFYPDSNFPMSNEMDIMGPYFDFSSEIGSHVFKDFYFIFNSISDIVNYLVFVIICMIIDICMVVQLRRTLEEKAKKSESINQKQEQNKKKSENEEAVNKAIKMVALNSAIGIFFKLPVCFIPLLNVSAQFFYNYINESTEHFNNFYFMLFVTGSIFLIQDLTHFLFTLSLSIQLYIYIRFDKKVQTGYERIKDKVLLKIKNFFKSKSNHN